MYRVVASDFVVWHALVFTWVLVIEKWFIQFFFQRSELLLICLLLCTSWSTFSGKSRILFAVHKVVLLLIEIVSVHWFGVIINLRHSFLVFLLLVLFVPLLFLLAFFLCFEIFLRNFGCNLTHSLSIDFKWFHSFWLLWAGFLLLRFGYNFWLSLHCFVLNSFLFQFLSWFWVEWDLSRRFRNWFGRWRRFYRRWYISINWLFLFLDMPIHQNIRR